MNIEIENLLDSAKSLLEEYKAFTSTLSPYNPFSRCEFDKKQPAFESRFRSIYQSFFDLEGISLSSDDVKQFEELRRMIVELHNEIF